MDSAKTILETNSKSDNYSIQSITKGKYIAMLKTNQTVSHSGKILLNKVGWSIRILSIITLISLLMLYYYFGSINPEEKPIMIYTSFVISLSIIVFVFGWIFYRNPSSKITNNPDDRIQDSEQDLFSVIIPIYN